MKKIFIAEKCQGDYCCSIDGSEASFNISEERYFEVTDDEYQKYKWFVDQHSDQYVLLKWIEKDSEAYLSFSEKVNRAWEKHVKAEEARKAAELKRRAASEASAHKRKLAKLAKLQAELGINTGTEESQ